MKFTNEKLKVIKDALVFALINTKDEVQEAAFGLLLGEVLLKIEAENMNPDYFYIQNKDAGYLGNAIMFCRTGNKGYTANLDNAQKYSHAEAKSHCQGSPDKFKAWPVDYIDNNKGIQRIVDSQYLDYDKIANLN